MLSDSVGVLKGVGEVKRKALSSMGIDTVGDLLFTVPRAYEDRTKLFGIAEAFSLSYPVCIKATVGTRPKKAILPGRRHVTKCRIFDDWDGAELVFFNRPYVDRQLEMGKEYVFFGRVTVFGSSYQLVNPEFEAVGKGKISGKILPVYHLTEGISRNFMTDIVAKALDRENFIEDFMPSDVLKHYGLISLDSAVRSVHFPQSAEDAKKASARLSFNELTVYSAALSQIKSNLKAGSAPKMKVISLNPFLEKLPFELTGAQKRTINEIFGDMYSGIPMNRLVQGDVGSGKTVVAAAAVYLSFLNGYQSSVIAPTELLAIQHFGYMSKILSPLGAKIELLVGSTTKKEKERIKQSLKSGEIDVLIGTHALLQDDVEFKNAALFVVDEQHRFGVAQREKFGKRGTESHTLVMSATPIPRTLNLIIYGELDVSLIDELPLGRQKIETYAVDESYDQRLFAFIRKQADQKGQVYIVCPLALENEESDLLSAEAYSEKLRKVFPDLKVAMLHGKLKAAEKQAIMSSFKSGETDILVSTTVIEVGVDVPNATLMIVRNAERFGLSQLHQLRGRVGRGPRQSYCILVSHSKTPRLKIMEKTDNGFEIAQEDLKIRGPGDFFGLAQHGLPRYSGIVNTADMETIKKAFDFSEKLIKSDPKLEKAENLWLFQRVSALRTKIGSAPLN